MSTPVRSFAVASAMAFVLACTGTAGDLVQQLSAFDIIPGNASTQTGGTLQFQVRPHGVDAGTFAVVWSVQETGGGSIDANGLYTAPSHAGTFHVNAARPGDTSSHAAATVTVTDSLVVVSITPGQAQVSPGGTVAFQAQVSGLPPGSDTGIDWSVEEQGGGTVDAQGRYTAPQATGTFHVVATSHAAPSASSAASVEVVPVPTVSVSIVPSSASTTPGRTLGFTATVSGTSAGQSTAVTWSVRESGGGTVDGTGKYVAPQGTGTFHVVATSVADPSKSASATITVTAAPVIAVAVDPQTATLRAGGTATFTATVTGTTSGQSTAVTWSVRESGGGTVDASGRYTAPAGAGTFHVVATSVADSSKSATGTVTVIPPIAVSVAPTTASIGAGTSTRFAATVTGTTSGQSTSVTWSVGETGGGSVDGSGLYTAPLTGGTFHVVATSAADTSKSATATVTVAAPNISVGIAPTNVSLAPGGAASFTATVSGTAPGQSTGVTWSVVEGSSGGTVDSGGRYTAPSTGGTFHVRATSAADSSKSATATVTVSAPAISVSIAPASVSLSPGGTATFTATVSGTTSGQSTAVTWSVVEGGAGGSIDSSGHYTAPSGSGTFHVSATSVADTTRSAAATVTVASPGPTDPGSLIPSDRRTLFQPGVTYNGGIPPRTTLCATLSPLGGSSDDTGQIQAAINGCPAGQTVKLNPGTFRINGNAIQMKSNVTLRGSGPGVTTLNSVGSGTPGTAVMFGTLYYRYADQRNFTADAAKDAYSVTVSNSGGLAVGEIVSVTELYDPNLTKYDNDAQLNGGDYLGWGECRVAHSDGTGYGDSGTGCPPISGWTAQKAMAQSRPMGQVMEIASVSGNTLTFSTPFHQTWRLDHGARLSRFAQNDGQTMVGSLVRMAGVEELSIANGGGTDDAGPVAFDAAAYCWAKHIEVYNGSAVNVLLKGSFRCELRDSYIHQTTDPNPGGGGYGIGIDSYSADNLVENNISWAFNKVMVMRSAGGGNVIAYNYMQDGYGAGYPTLPEVGLNASHMATSHHELFEGNESHNFSSDTTWGNTIDITVFRNHLTGLRIGHPGLLASIVDQGNRRAADISDGDKWFSFVANVLGYQGMPLNASMPGGMTGQTSWQYEPGNDSDQFAMMWKLFTADAPAQSTLLRMGNFDWVTQTQKWPGLGGIGTPDNPPSPLPTIVNSMYTSTKPPFFGSNPWPWVDPSTGRTYVLPARARFDSGTPNSGP